MPRCETERLLLRPPESGDAPAIARWLGDYEVAKNLAIPYPFTMRDAEHLVAKAAEDLAKGEAYSFAVLRKDSGRLLGFCSLTLSDGVYKLSVWLGRPFWDRGYASEAARKVVSFAFHSLKAEKVQASWFDDNPASGRVLGKLGFLPLASYARDSLARGGHALCHRMELDRRDFGRKRSVQSLCHAAQAEALGA